MNDTHYTRWKFLLWLPLLSLPHFAIADDLLDVYRVAERNDTELRSADAGRRAAEQRHKQAVAQLIVQADLNADVTSSRREIGDDEDDSTSSGYSLSLIQPIYHHDTYKLMAQTDALVAQAKANYEAVRQNLITRVAERYFNVLAANDNLEFTRAEKEANARQLEQTTQRFEVGLIAITDVHESQAAFDLSVAQEISARNILTNAHEALRELTGEYHQNLALLVDEIPLITPEPADPQAWVDMALKENYQVIAAQAAVESARQEIKKQQAEHLPFFDLVGSHSYTDDGSSTFLGDEDITTSSISFQMTLPLSRGGGTMARVRESEALYSQQRESLEQVVRAIQRQASEAFHSVIARVSEVKAFKQGIISTQSALDASEAGLEVGTRTTVDVLNVRRELFRAQRDHARARYDYILSTLSLREAAGSLSVEIFERINEFLK